MSAVETVHAYTCSSCGRRHVQSQAADVPQSMIKKWIELSVFNQYVGQNPLAHCWVCPDCVPPWLNKEIETVKKGKTT